MKLQFSIFGGKDFFAYTDTSRSLFTSQWCRDWRFYNYFGAFNKTLSLIVPSKWSKFLNFQKLDSFRILIKVLPLLFPGSKPGNLNRHFPRTRNFLLLFSIAYTLANNKGYLAQLFLRIFNASELILAYIKKLLLLKYQVLFIQKTSLLFSNEPIHTWKGCNFGHSVWNFSISIYKMMFLRCPMRHVHEISL